MHATHSICPSVTSFISISSQMAGFLSLLQLKITNTHYPFSYCHTYILPHTCCLHVLAISTDLSVNMGYLSPTYLFEIVILSPLVKWDSWFT